MRIMSSSLFFVDLNGGLTPMFKESPPIRNFHLHGQRCLVSRPLSPRNLLAPFPEGRLRYLNWISSRSC